MRIAQDGISARRKRGRFWLLMLALLLCAGAVYLAGSKKNLTALQEWFSATPPVEQAALPAKPSVAAPSFDIAYADEAGKLVAAGGAEAGWIIRLATGTQTLGETKADENGEWVLIPEQPLAPGEHTLSLSAVDPVSRRSISGQRSVALSIAPRRESVRQANTGKPIPGPATEITTSQASRSSDTQKDCAVTIVKRGDTLWQLANACYGDGAKYSRIFESNRPQIRNPNLIFPDQQLSFPH